MKTNLFFFNEDTLANRYGIGSYSNEFFMSLKNTDIKCNSVLFNSNRFTQNCHKGYTEWLLPKSHYNPKQIAELTVRFIKANINDESNLIFHFNYLNNIYLVEELKRTFDCKVVLTVHYLNWIEPCKGDITAFRKIVNEQNAEYNELRQKTQEEKEFLKAVDAVIAPSDYIRNFLISDYGVESTKITKIYNGLADSYNENKSTIELEKRYNLPQHHKKIVFASRLKENKGIGELIEAFKIVLQHNPATTLIVAGDEFFGNKYTTLAKEMKDNVVFTGRLDKEQLSELYHCVDIGIVPSFFETFCYSAAEMMMHRLPLIVTQTSALTELVLNEQTGLTIPITDNTISIELFADKIMYLLNNAEKAKQMGMSGRNRFLELFEAQRMKEELINFYSQLNKQKR